MMVFDKKGKQLFIYLYVTLKRNYASREWSCCKAGRTSNPGSEPFRSSANQAYRRII